MRNILKPQSGTPSGTGDSPSKNSIFSVFLMRGENLKIFPIEEDLLLESLLSASHISNFLFDMVHTILARMFEKFRKQKEEEDASGSEMVEERPDSDKEFSSVQEVSPEPTTETRSEEIPQEAPAQPEIQSQSDTSSSGASEIGIRSLMDKRVKLEDAIDYVGLMIKNLKDKRTSLEKDIEDESVDVKNLKEKLMKVSEYIEEEKQGIQNLTRKRSAVESEADEVGNLINSFRNKLSGIDSIINSEGERIKNFKDSRPK